MRSDESLAIGIQRGSKEDMRQLTERYYDALLNYMYRMCGGRQVLAEDLVQETFLRLMRKIMLYDPTMPFKPWLYAVASNIARNHFQLADTRHTDNPPEDADFTDGQPLPEESLIASEDVSAVIGAIMQLPDHQREVVVLYYYEEMPQKDIAEILDIPIGTVKSRLSLALKRLRSVVDSMERQS